MTDRFSEQSAIAVLVIFAGIFTAGGTWITTNDARNTIYATVSIPTLILSVYASFFKDRIKGPKLIFTKPFEITKIYSEENIQITGSIYNLGDTGTFIRTNLKNPALQIFRHLTRVKSKDFTNSYLGQLFFLKPGEIVFMQMYHKIDLDAKSSKKFDYEFTDKEGNWIKTTEVIDFEKTS